MGRHVSYDKISSKKLPQSPRRGFRLRRTRKLCVNWLRVRFFSLLRFYCKWKYLFCDHFTKILVMRNTRPRTISSGANANNSKNNAHSSHTTPSVRGGTINAGGHTRYSSYDYLNTFHSEAISECLDYIKLSSVVSAAKKESLVAAHDALNGNVKNLDDPFTKTLPS